MIQYNNNMYIFVLEIKGGISNLKKLLAMLLALTMVLGLLAGCGASGVASTSDTAVESAAQSADEADAAEEAPDAAPAQDAAEPAESSAAEEPEDAEEPANAGPFEAASADLPIADGVKFSYFVELPGYMSMFNVNSYADVPAWAKAVELTGVDMDFTIVNMESLQTTFSLMAASGDFTDMIAGASAQYSSTEQMLEDGAAIDLMEYKDQMPNYWKVLDYYDDYKTVAITQDGYLPEAITVADDYREQAGLQIRQDWLDDMGADIPTTFDELHDVLLAFANDYGADHALLLTGSAQMTGSALVGGYGSVGFEGADTTANMFVVDGKIQNGFLADGYKDYMEMVAQWYAEGIIARDFATESNDPFTSNADAYISGGNAGVWSSQSDNMDSNQASGESLTPGYKISPMAQITLDGEKFHFADSGVGVNAMGKNVSITEDCEDVDTAVAWLDFWYTDEGIKLANYGIEGESWEYNAEGKPELTDLVLHNDQFPMISFATTYYTLACVATLQDYHRQDPAYSEANLAAMELWTETSDDLYTLPSQVELTQDENLDYSNLWSDIATYAATEVFKFVMGEYNFDSDWDNFIDTLKDMGLEDCIDIYQDAYDRYVEAYEA